MSTTSFIDIRDTAFDHPDSETLRAAQRIEIDARYGGDTEPGTKPSASDVPVFVVAYDAAGRAVGCGGLRRLDDASAEIKRMFVTPYARGTGVSVAVLRALEARALERGWSTLRLETGTAQPDAMRFYEREGYSLIPNFGAYVGEAASLCYERRLG
ncbi:GNAT family N-acetyltransferase [Agreia bicolorata]|uniref:GNAT family N-acetyltransferase n=1 Tax=Agreia bicolorata TaxID=110935 RepID=UPI000AD87336|nr:GNAT family N-acetyltransferase [Agreia bicolorata]